MNTAHARPETSSDRPRAAAGGAGAGGELRVRLCGVPEVRLGGQPATPRRRSAMALLAYLAVTGRAHRRETLAALLSDDGEDQAARLLCNSMYEVRAAVGGHLIATPQEVGLDPARPRWLDVAAFRTRLGAALDAGDVAAIEAALRLYQEEFLAGLALRDAPSFEAWLLQQREELLLLSVRGLQAVVDHRVRFGPPEAGIAAARRLLALEPWREEAHRQLMVLLARTGRRSTALKQFEVCRRVLAEELATEPEPATAELAARLRAGPRPVPHNLPPEPVPFVGREAELALLAVRLADPDTRVLSLAGLGGAGKSRLALEAARRLVAADGAFDEPPFRDGVFVVPLADVAPGETEADAAGRVALAVAGVLGIALPGEGHPVPALAAALRDRALLLVLDDFERLVDAGAVLWALVRGAPGLKLVVTSRVRLRLLGAWELVVGGLPLPEGLDDLEGAGASALFLQQAGRLAPAALDPADRAGVVRLCRLVGGQPLPLLLAAAWYPLLSPAEIAAELEAAVDVPGAPLRGLPARQRRVGDVLDAAWGALPAADQAVLRWLPLFRGGFTRAAAQGVLGASPQQLRALQDAFLVSAGDGGRYELPELVRCYATRQQAGRPAERARAEVRFAAYFADYVQELAPALARGQPRAAALGWEEANLLAAWERAGAHAQPELLERLRPGLRRLPRLKEATIPPAASGAPVLQTFSRASSAGPGEREQIAAAP